MTELIELPLWVVLISVACTCRVIFEAVTESIIIWRRIARSK